MSLVVFFLVSTIFLFNFINDKISVEVPSYGGEFSEGIIGTPRFINPVLAISDADHDLTRLVYAGLMKKPRAATLFPNLPKVTRFHRMVCHIHLS